MEKLNFDYHYHPPYKLEERLPVYSANMLWWLAEQ